MTQTDAKAFLKKAEEYLASAEDNLAPNRPDSVDKQRYTTEIRSQ